jgi:hypothetical protein
MKKQIFSVVLIIFIFSSFAYAEEKITVSAFTSKESFCPEEEMELRIKMKNSFLSPYNLEVFIQWDILKVEYQSVEMLLESEETVASEIEELSGGFLSLSVMDIFPEKEEADIFKIVFKVKTDALYGKSNIAITSQNTEIITPQIEFSIECKEHIADREKDRYLDDVVRGCENGATIIHTCLACSAKFFESVEPLGHDTPKWDEIAPTCRKNGERVAECKRCGKMIKEKIPALGHNFSDWITSKQSSCIEDGRKERTCKTCGEKEIEIIESAGHKFSESVIIKYPTDKETGISEKKCKICAASLKEVIAKLEKTETESGNSSETTKEENKSENTSSKMEPVFSSSETLQEESEITEETIKGIEVKEVEEKDGNFNLLPIIIILSAVLVFGAVILLIFLRKRRTRVYNPESDKEQLPF